MTSENWRTRDYYKHDTNTSYWDDREQQLEERHKELIKLKNEGHTDLNCAAILGVSISTIERDLRIIRDLARFYR